MTQDKWQVKGKNKGNNRKMKDKKLRMNERKTKSDIWDRK